MSLFDPTFWRSGEYVKATKLNEMVSAIHALNAMAGQRDTPPTPDIPLVFPAKTTNFTLAFAEVVRNSAGTGWDTASGGITGTAVHPSGASNLASGVLGQVVQEVDVNGAVRYVFWPVADSYPAIVTASSGTAPGATYTVKFAEASSSGYGNWAAQTSAPSLTAYNLWENIDRVTAGTLTLDPDGDSTDEGTIKNIPNNEIVRIHWAGSGGWWFDKPCDILTDCDA